ncbi:hypothetical protein IU438_11325 [Nocardia cyriacigeorgica]|uniref:hypothetical protein n=1 Tax=Nocardia cyriacigeorgica TaxID=135487 RepID=UPI001893474B|nr:hypothetical protein [Nocardia cyriacigeorgica]MBF6316960.1 hypothetical protein [Nocardia cyriacigeorgica]MBF6396383.1 hypothetical protein [Nocardia cyriacigeorgica]MBF6402015.1 hypothetical protein [Nocardia cyriacigeorgica]MBF6532488.1 hypothetical protein [Nocardia cyriacigeorgica]
MTTLVVDPAVYTAAGSRLYSLATTYHQTFSAHVDVLAGTANMGGNVGESKAWATSYDSTVSTAMRMTELLVTAMGNYAEILNKLGYNHALADYVEGSGRPEPVEPPTLSPAWSICVGPPPSAGGPGSGLFDDVGFAVSALEEFGVSIPDGEPDDLQAAADAWDRLASEAGVGNLPAWLDHLARTFETETAPDAAAADEDIRELKKSAEGLITLYKDLAGSSRAHRSAILEFRKQLGQLLVDLAKDLAQEAAETVVLSVVAGALTAGFGAAAIAAAKAGKLALKMKKYVDRVLEAKRTAGFVDKVAETGEDLDARRAELQRIADLLAQRAADIAKAAQAKLQKSLDHALSKEAMEHVFVPKHKLDGLVKSLGGEEATMREIIESVQGVPDGVYDGSSPLVRTINGQTVHIRGAMIDGVFKIGTAYIP